MADPTNLTDTQFLETDPDVLGLQRQRQLANLLTGQAFNQPQGQMISGHYVKPSALQQALPMINAAIGGLTNANLDTKQQELAAALRGKQMEVAQQYASAKTPQERMAAAMSPYAPKIIQTAFAERMKPQKLGAEESLVSEDFGTGQFTPIATGGIKLGQELKDAARQVGLDPTKADQWTPQQWNSVRAIENQINQSKRSVTNINMGQHGFDNTLKLGENFKNEPIYKAFQEVSQAYKQVNASLDRNDAAGDYAAAIKINKMFDPGSVVKETEAARVAASRGILDTMSQLTEKVTRGETLTPEQRKQYKSLVKEFYDIAGNQYNQTRGKYSEIGKENKLSGTDTILGPEWSATDTSVKWGTAKVK